MSNIEQGISNIEQGMSNIEQGMSNIEQGMSNNEVGKPSNLEVAIKIAEYGTRKANPLEHRHCQRQQTLLRYQKIII